MSASRRRRLGLFGRKSLALGVQSRQEALEVPEFLDVVPRPGEQLFAREDHGPHDPVQSEPPRQCADAHHHFAHLPRRAGAPLEPADEPQQREVRHHVGPRAARGFSLKDGAITLNIKGSAIG